MTLKTVTGPSLRQALADARRLFGDDVVLLQSSPATEGGAASVTVAFDDGPPRPRRRLPQRAATPAVPEGGAVAARPYGYPVVRKEPPAAEPISAPPAPAAPPAVVARPVVQRPVAPPAAPPAAVPPPAAEAAGAGRGGVAPAVVPSVSVEDVDALRARLADLEAKLAALPAAAPAPPTAPERLRPLVLVGAAGSGKTSLALRLARTPALVGAERPAVVVVASDDEHAVDPAPTYWRAGVPVAVVRTADEVREALQTFDEADRLVVDTPSLPLDAARAAPLVARLGEVLAPLAAVDVCLVVEASRAPATLTAEAVAALGLRPDALALTRLDEAPGGAGDGWAQRLGLGVRFASAGTGADDLSANAHPAPAAPVPEGVRPSGARPADLLPPPEAPALEDVVLTPDIQAVAAPPASGDGAAPARTPIGPLGWTAPFRPTDAVTA